jgi:hypothetical protein
VIVPEEAVSDRAPGPHYANLSDINTKYGDVVPLAEALERPGGGTVAAGRERAPPRRMARESPGK